MTDPQRTIPPGTTIGIVGGGQLGRMLSVAAAQLGYRCAIYAPEPCGPAADVSAEERRLPEEADEAEPQSVELVFWESIKDSLRAADYEAYLEQYPEGNFVTLARTRLEEFAAAHVQHERDACFREAGPHGLEAHVRRREVAWCVRGHPHGAHAVGEPGVEFDQRPLWVT